MAGLQTASRMDAMKNCIFGGSAMSIRPRIAVALCAGVWAVTGIARADPMAPEQRQQMRQQMREHWQQMPPEQRDARRQEYRERGQQMPSEERQRIREEMRERGGYGEERHHGRGDRR